MRKPLFLVSISILSLAACKPSNPEPAVSPAVASQPDTTPAFAVNQADLCETKEWRYDAVASLCKRGQKVVYLPESFGNEQLPIIFAAVNCDLRYQVVQSKGAVACIYGPITPKPAMADKTP